LIGCLAVSIFPMFHYRRGWTWFGEDREATLPQITDDYMKGMIAATESYCICILRATSKNVKLAHSQSRRINPTEEDEQYGKEEAGNSNHG
jgi:hypothetical protein